jgi:transposase
MMGESGGWQDQLFYSFHVEDHVPPDHLLRGINRFLDWSELRKHLSTFYSHTGGPSIDPDLMTRMLIVGYCFWIRSERRLRQKIHLNLAYRWFCGLGLEDRCPTIRRCRRIAMVDSARATRFDACLKPF